MNTPDNIIFGLNAPELAFWGVVGVAAYYFGKRMFNAVNSTSN